MSFTKDELLGIIVMCKHERTLMDTIGEMIQGIKIHHAQAIVAATAEKAAEMVEAMEKAEAAKKLEKVD